MLELLVSPPGTGKTEYCIKVFREQILKSKSGIDSRSFFVLPNREHAERIQRLVLRGALRGLFNAHIVTINDLAAHLLGASFKAAPSQNVRRRVVRELLADPALMGGLPYFEAVRELPGFAELAADTVCEFKAARLGVDEFEKRAQILLKNPAFRAKYRDFTVLLKNYDLRLESMGLKEPEDGWAELVGRLLEAETPELLIFDGFYHFTKAQRELLSALSRRAGRTVVTLTMSPGPRLEALFAYPEQTRKFLMGVGARHAVPLHRPLTENHRTKDPALRHLEANLFCPDPKRFAKPQGAVSVIRASTPRAEIERAARRILRFHRVLPLHWSDICLIFRRIGDYERVISSVFGEFGIPVHIHERKKMIENGLLGVMYRLLRHAESGDTADLELALNSSHARRASATEETLKKAVSSPERLLDLARSWVSNGEEQAAFQAFEKGLRKTEPAAMLQEARLLIETGLFTLRPEGKNRVQVYDAVMALPKEYKIVFISGLIERQFPAALHEHALFDDPERRALNAGDPVLEERRLRAAGERYFFYMAATRAKERLILTCPAQDADGRAATPSLFIEEAERCFKNGLPVEKRTSADFLPEPEEWAGPREVTRGLAEIVFSRQDARGVPFFGEWTGHPGFRAAVLPALEPRPNRLTDPRALDLFARSGPLSSTLLKTFATCPYKYFAHYALRLEEPPGDYEDRIAGTLLHEVLEKFYGRLTPARRESGDFLLDLPAARAALRGTLDEIWEARKPFQAEPRYRQKLIRRGLERMLDDFPAHEAEWFKRRGFVPTHFEWKFEDLRVPSPGGDILVGGTIDRIDVEKGGRRAVVIDYKRSGRKLNKDLEAGLEFQLPVYVLAARRLLGLDVHAAEHRVLRKKEVNHFASVAAKELYGRHKLRSEADFERLLALAEENIRRQAERIRQGDISVKSRSCAYCPYAPVCRFEKWRLVYSATEASADLQSEAPEEEAE
ncbi:MAG: hypothetical protein A3D28_03425 [Omnitrophica bacterium RIFCSPHIGHO2_02_FULL_63_14]|nr:MAG: hypothetical protein A3D28_03425 [Omnitrophica bacterium RIFCSPHIGHO2_02_FULL_63_14]